jgi:dihydroorotase
MSSTPDVRRAGVKTLPTLLRGGRVLDAHRGLDVVADVLVTPHGCVVDLPSRSERLRQAARIVDVDGCWVVPGLVDLQVHFREPGFTHKEDLLSGSRAALAGGVTTCVVMPNTQPTLDDPALVAEQARRTFLQGGVRILVAAAATKGLLGTQNTDVAALKAAGAVALTDDGLPVLDDDVMARALAACREHDLVFFQHAEDLRQTKVEGHHAPMSESETQRKARVRGQPRRAESDVVARDLVLAQQIGARYHVLHCSTRASLELVRAAKAAGARVTCEASPHHLLLTDADVVRAGVTEVSSAHDLDSGKKMNPPLRAPEDRAALVAGLVDGTVDAVATDHAPHAADEKARGFVDAPFGVIGLETAFAALLTFVHDKTITPLRAVELMTAGPARVLGRTGSLGTFDDATGDVAVIDPNASWTVTPGRMLSRSKNSAFLGRTFQGRVVQTYLRGLRVWDVVDGVRG